MPGEAMEHRDCSHQLNLPLKCATYVAHLELIMTITTKIRRQGGAAVVTIPPAVLQLMQTQVGDQLSLVVSDGTLVARPVDKARPHYTLSELLVGSEEMEKLSSRTAWALDGDATGREIG